MISIDRSLRQADGHVRGVSSARLMLAVLILVLQSIQVSTSFGTLMNSPLWVLMVVLPPAVLTLSGFLLAQSANRLSAREYLLHRVRRVIPPLAIAIVFLATVFGPIFTLSSLSDYVRDASFAQFFLNIIGVPQYVLPNVFEFNNLSDEVHAGFWLLPYLFITPLLIKFLALPQNGTRWLSIAFVALAATAILFDIFEFPLSGIIPIDGMLHGPGLTSLSCALFGALLYTTRPIVRLDGRIFFVALGILGAVAILGNAQWIDRALVDILLVPAIGYATLYLMFALPRGPAWLERHNLSYGIFLYGFPVQQAWIQISDRDQPWTINLLLTLPVVFILAALSWYMIERRTAVAAAPGNARSESGAKLASVGAKPRVRRASWYIQKVRSAAPALMILLFLIAILLIVLLMTMLAFQPESGGA